MAKVDGFEVRFAHRGAWKADLLPPGKESRVIPVTWKEDWDPKTGTVVVWFKTPQEINDYMAQEDGFSIAIAVKDPSGQASSDNIIGIFSVKPIRRSDDPQGVLCKIGKRLRPADFR